MLSSPSSASSVPPSSRLASSSAPGILHHHPVHLLRGRSSSPSPSSLTTHSSVLSAVLTSTGTGVCSACGGRITSAASACQALGCFYHNECFICCCCRRTLRGKTFYKDQDKIYCEEDYLYHGFQRMAEKCAACGHIISQSILQGMGKSYHPGCFRCCICNTCMDGEKFTVDGEGHIYCLFDYYLAHAPTCAACAHPILPEGSSEEVVRVVAMNREFHIKCYRCEDCDMFLSDEAATRCYPLVESIEGVENSMQRTHLLCLNCHLTRIGASPNEACIGAGGEPHTSSRWRGSNGGAAGSSSSSSIASTLDLVAPRVYSPTPTSYGIAPISSKGPTAVTKPWSPRPGCYLNNNG